ncbi:MAG: hypothetical protein ACYTFG_00950 [Planctomycetota bacterium]|jgi:hypothetical protein
MIDQVENSEAPIVYLAMFWGGGGPFKISQILHVYDWVNRALPTREDLVFSLNALLAMGLVERSGENFRVSPTRGEEFDAFRKRRRKSKFETVRLYFSQLDRLPDIPETITMTREEYDGHVREYRRFMST